MSFDISPPFFPMAFAGEVVPLIIRDSLLLMIAFCRRMLIMIGAVYRVVAYFGLIFMHRNKQR